MAKHFTTIILLPTIIFLDLASGLTIPENVKNFHKKAEKLVAENPNQFDAYNYMVSLSNVNLRVNIEKNKTKNADHAQVTVAINELLCLKNGSAQISMFFTSNE